MMILLAWWGIELLPKELEKNNWTIWASRAYLIMLFIVLAILVFIADRRRNKENES